MTVDFTIDTIHDNPINLATIPLDDALHAIAVRNAERIRLKSQATPGFWHSCLGSGENCCTGIAADPEAGEERRKARFVCDVAPSYVLDDDEVWEHRIGNLKFIAHARNDDVETEIAFLLAEVERLRRYEHPHPEWTMRLMVQCPDCYEMTKPRAYESIAHDKEGRPLPSRWEYGAVCPCGETTIEIEWPYEQLKNPTAEELIALGFEVL